MRALVLALNPSIDVEWRVPCVRWEEKNEVLGERRWPGGKGVNVARWIQHLGGEARLLLPLGGVTGRELAAGLRLEHLAPKIVRLNDATRANVIVTTKGQGQLRFNPLGPRLSRGEWEAVLRATDRELSRAQLLVLSGSLPRGVPTDAYAQLISRSHRAEVRTLLDCDGPALAKAVAAKPFLVKPNVNELARWCGEDLKTSAAVQDAGTAMARMTGGYVLVSLGAGGALLLNSGAGLVVAVKPPRVRVLNTVGAGDALLAAVAMGIAAGGTVEEWARTAVGAGTAAVSCLAGKLAPVSTVLKLAGRTAVVSRGNSGTATPLENRGHGRQR